jgi:hypothetical protein
MAVQVQLRRGTSSENNSFTGAIGEVTVDTTNDTLRVHDGATAGGFTVVTTGATQTLTNKTLAAFTLSGNITGDANISGFANVVGNITSSGNIQGTYILGNGALLTGVITSVANINLGTSNVTVVSSGGNITVGIGGTSNVTVFSTGGANVAGFVTATGNVTGGNLTTAGVITVNSGDAATAIVNGGSNAVGNIGSSSKYFNTVFAKATSAQYADLAEMYEADEQYAPGTVLSFSGDQEVTKSTVLCDRRVAGVVSTNPAYIMNSSISSDRAVAVALVGKVPTQVTGTVRKGDLMVSAGDGTACVNNDPPVGSVLGKSLEDFDGVRGVINIVVGRL